MTALYYLLPAEVTAATRGQYLALSKAWQSCTVCWYCVDITSTLVELWCLCW